MISVRIFCDFLTLLFIACPLLSPASSDTVPAEEFGQNILSTITKYLDDEKSGSSNSEISKNIKNDLSSSTFSTGYSFAVAIYDDISKLSGDSRIAKEGNDVFTFSKNGKNALVLANPKSASQNYEKCEFWNFLSEDEICGKSLNDVIEMIKNKCNGVTDLAVIKMIPSSLDGYVSPEFDADAFSVSGFGLGECFHYSIWVANVNA